MHMLHHDISINFAARRSVSSMYRFDDDDDHHDDAPQ